MEEDFSTKKVNKNRTLQVAIVKEGYFIKSGNLAFESFSVDLFPQ